ncbi:MAG: UDP-3-O-(3-hydroxymyristoyl)glucosamine N-acyltransferase [Planctomycetes bacterium]|nr:UDP-3-O-(3-hydroxymyristoyl)glucosamine N-acyltransferase [Planctomycetota bacterium]
MKLTVKQLAERIGGELVGDGSGQISRVDGMEAAGDSSVTFITDSKHASKLGTSQAGAVIVGQRIEGLDKPQLIVKDVNAALVETLGIFAPRVKSLAEGIDPAAKVSETAKIAKGVAVGANAVIDDGVEIGENTVISSGCRIGENAKVGKNCRFDSNVVIYHNCVIGNNVIIQANSTIGGTGFGYYFIDGAHRLIPHNGGVVIEDFVEIGTNSCIDRAKFGNTVIGAGTKIDNLVQIAHNIVIGKCCLIAGQAGIGGSAKIGDGVVLAGRVGVKDNVEIGDGAQVGVIALVTNDIEAGKQVLGFPAIDARKELRLMKLRGRLPEMAEQLKELSVRIKKLEASKDDKK